jgi:hypothetical protein
LDQFLKGENGNWAILRGTWPKELVDEADSWWVGDRS